MATSRPLALLAALTCLSLSARAVPMPQTPTQPEAAKPAAQPASNPQTGSQPKTAEPSKPASATQPASDTKPASETKTGDSMTTPADQKPKLEKALFGAGCFWGVEHIFRKDVPGVVDAVCGYAGGSVPNPTYERVCDHDTGHAEVVLVTFDPAKTSYDKLVDAFFRLHDPTQVNRQGPDVGDQYRSVIFYYSPEQKKVAEEVKARRAPKYSKPIATQIEPAPEFYKAEEYHQKYYIKHNKQPYCHVLRPD